MKKRLLALVLGAALALSLLGGCGSGKGDKDSASQETEKESVEEKEEESGDNSGTKADRERADEDPAALAIAQRKADAEKNGKYQKVVFAFYNWTGRPAGTDRIQEKLNEHFREKLGLEVEILLMDSASYTQNARLMLSSGEQIDIFNSCPLGYTACVNDGYCLDLEEDDLIQTYGKGILDTISADYIQACRINNILYGIPQMRDMAMAPGTYCIGQEYLDGIGYDYTSLYEDPRVQDVIYTDYETLDDIFSQLHEKYPNKYVFAVGDNLISQGTGVDPVGGDWFGVLLDPANSLTVENLFTSDLFKEKCQMVYEWNQKGYISKDALTDDTALSAKVKSGSYMAMMAQGKPGYKTQISGECGSPMIVFQTEEDIMKSSAVTGILWHINQGCEDPVAAIQVMELLYTDPDVSNLIIWGEEGTEYVETPDGHITFAQGVNAENSEWYHTMNWLLPNQYIAHIWEGDSLDLWERMEEFNDNSVKSKALGFTFDNSEYATEYTALTNVYDEYIKQIMYGFVDPETGIAQMQEKLENAGLNDYIAAKQKALDDWAAANGVN